MKKYVVILFGIWYLGFSFAKGTTITSWDNYVQPWETKIVTQDIKWETINDLNFIWMRFCNNWLELEKLTNSLQLKIQPGQKKDLCMVFFNTSSDKSIDMKFGFSSTNINKEWGISCDDDMTTKNDFSKLIDQINNTWFILPPNGKIIKKLKIFIPLTYTGNIIYWCLSYKINKEEKMEPGQMFLLVFRKTAPIQIIVTWGVYQFWRRDDIKDVYTINKTTILKIIIAILGLWIILTIVQTTKKKPQAKKK